MHPEVGHIRVVRKPADAVFAGCCPFHADCVEGLASGPAISLRWGAQLNDLPADHEAHALIADYLGQACATLALTVSTDRIVIGGVVSNVIGIHAAIADRMRYWLAGYLSGPVTDDPLFISAPALADRAGLIGALVLTERAIRAF